MNKMKYIIQILIAITLLGCTDEEIFKNKGDIEVTAGFAKTRTTFVEDDGITHVTWNTGDAIGLFTKEQNNLQYTALNDGDETKFGALGESLKAIEGEKVYAYYPYSGVASQNPIIPNIAGQYYKKNTSEYDFIYASDIVTNSKVVLQFKHLFAFLKITIPLDLIADRGEEGGIFIVSSEHISCQGNNGSPYFSIESEGIGNADFFNWMYYYIPSNEKLGNEKEVTCYIAILPQTDKAELKIFKYKAGFQGDCLLTKKVLPGGLKAGNVYTLYLNENETEIARKKQRDALVALYKATDGDNWKNNANWCSEQPISEWYGISARPDGWIQKIDLQDNNLSGIIPDEIGYIENLGHITLSDNGKLSGNIPRSIGNLDYLSILDIQNCQLEGEIPEEIGKLKNLHTIDLSNNRLTGSIPSEIGNMTALRYFFIGNNRLTGSIPTEIGNMTALRYFHIGNSDVGAGGGDIEMGEDTGRSNNQISGSIPIELCRLPNLTSFSAGRNKLSGDIPDEIWCLPSLTSLTLSGNQLTGKITSNIRNAKRLKQLWLQNNLLTGTLPEEICELSELEELLIGNAGHYIDGTIIQEYNHFEGNLPNGIGKLSTLRQLDIGNAGLNGNLPQSLYQLHSIEIIMLGNATSGKVFNSFNGVISKDIVNLQTLEYLDLSHNNIEGSLPEEFVELPKLRGLLLGYNRLSGLIPNRLSQSSQWKSWDPEVWILPQQEGYMLTFDSYASIDFSKDGEVITLQDHTKGNGIKLVLMGDAFVDTDMEYGGKYETMMRKAMERYFSVEPFKSLREYYDVVCIKAVSKNDWIGKETAFEAKYGDGTYIGGNNDKCMEYAQKALGINSVDDVQVITVLNDSKYAGTCHMYSNGFSIAYCPYVNNSDQSFGEMIHHEANGHGFGFLGDEYAYEGVISLSEIEDATNLYTNYGWYANIDFTSNPSQVKWNYFISDSRYTNEEIGVYEGGLTYSQGVYRPTETSIMVDNTGQFNAPSREAIYKRAMKIANGNSWVYNYEDFVLFDAPARTATRAIKHYQPRKDFKPTVPPVIYNYPAVAK